MTTCTHRSGVFQESIHVRRWRAPARTYGSKRLHRVPVLRQNKIHKTFQTPTQNQTRILLLMICVKFVRQIMLDIRVQSGCSMYFASAVCVANVIVQA